MEKLSKEVDGEFEALQTLVRGMGGSATPSSPGWEDSGDEDERWRSRGRGSAGTRGELARVHRENDRLKREARDATERAAAAESDVARLKAELASERATLKLMHARAQKQNE